MSKPRDATLLYLFKRENGVVTQICLAMKKRGLGAGKWNGAGGKVEAGESIEEAAIRETSEEIGVTPRNILKVAELTFQFPHKPSYDQTVHVYVAESWDGNLLESEEMAPSWFATGEIPWNDCWPSDEFWMPRVLQGEFVTATFHFSEDEKILYKMITARVAPTAQ